MVDGNLDLILWNDSHYGPVIEFMRRGLSIPANETGDLILCVLRYLHEIDHLWPSSGETIPSTQCEREGENGIRLLSYRSRASVRSPDYDDRCTAANASSGRCEGLSGAIPPDSTTGNSMRAGSSTMKRQVRVRWIPEC